MIDPYVMLAIGALLIVAELLSLSFFLFFFGLGFLIIGVANFWLPGHWYHQILFVLFVSLVLLFFLKKPLRERFGRKKEKFSKDSSDDGSIGIVRGGMIYYKGALWRYDGDELEEGVKVKVRGTIKDTAILER